MRLTLAADLGELIRDLSIFMRLIGSGALPVGISTSLVQQLRVSVIRVFRVLLRSRAS